MSARERLDSPIGLLTVVTSDAALVAVHFGGLPTVGDVRDRRHRDVIARLHAYFDGDLGAVGTIAVAPVGTPFQHQVWQALRQIPAGSILTYRGLAERIGRPAAVRAVGAANGANPIPIVVPCHRLVGSNGSLVKYGGGLAGKRWLLRHEGVASAALVQAPDRDAGDAPKRA